MGLSSRIAHWPSRRRTRTVILVLALLALVAAVDGARIARQHGINDAIRSGRLPAEAPGTAAESSSPVPQPPHPGPADPEEDVLNRYRALQDDTPLGRAARFNTANALMRQAIALRATAQPGQAIPLIELAKETYRELLRANRETGAHATTSSAPSACCPTPKTAMLRRPSPPAMRSARQPRCAAIRRACHDEGVGSMSWLRRGLAACRVSIRRAFTRHLDRTLLIGAALALAATFLNPVATVDRALFDQVIVLDITQSMNVTDYQLEGKPVSRLSYAKHALRQLLLELPCGSKVGWGVFTEYRSFLLIAPQLVCENLTELRSTLDNIDGRMAWTGNSEVAKGLFSGIGIARQLPDKPSLVFVTDGHESPPVNPQHRPVFNDKPGVVQGLIVGVGGLRPFPIPKFDPARSPDGPLGRR